MLYWHVFELEEIFTFLLYSLQGKGMQMTVWFAFCRLFRNGLGFDFDEDGRLDESSSIAIFDFLQMKLGLAILLVVHQYE